MDRKLGASDEQRCEALTPAFNHERLLRRAIDEAQWHRMIGIRTLREADDYEAEERRRERDRASARARQSASYLYTERKANRGSRYLNRDDAGLLSPRDGAFGKGGGGSMEPLEVVGLEGHELLSASEIKTCSDLRFLPAQYMLVKDTLVKEDFQLDGRLDADRAVAVVDIGPDKARKVYEFLVGCGFVGRGLTAFDAAMGVGASLMSQAPPNPNPEPNPTAETQQKEQQQQQKQQVKQERRPSRNQNTAAVAMEEG